MDETAAALAGRSRAPSQAARAEPLRRYAPSAQPSEGGCDGGAQARAAGGGGLTVKTSVVPSFRTPSRASREDGAGARGRDPEAEAAGRCGEPAACRVPPVAVHEAEKGGAAAESSDG
jgi:hypothetical protein